MKSKSKIALMIFLRIIQKLFMPKRPGGGGGVVKDSML